MGEILEINVIGGLFNLLVSPKESSSSKTAILTSLISIHRSFPAHTLSTVLNFIKSENSRLSRLEGFSALHSLIVSSVSKNDAYESSKELISLFNEVIEVVALEMSSTSDILPEIQKPCSEILLSLSSFKSYFTTILQLLLSQLETGVSSSSSFPHYYTLVTLGSLASCNYVQVFPYFKTLLQKLNSLLSSSRVKEDFKIGISFAYRSIGTSLTAHGSLTDDLSPEIDTFHDVLFTSWLPSGSSKSKMSFLETLAVLTPLCSSFRNDKHSLQFLTVYNGLLKKMGSSSSLLQALLASLTHLTIESSPSLPSLLFDSLFSTLFVTLSGDLSSTSDSSLPSQVHFLLVFDKLFGLVPFEKALNSLLIRFSSSEEPGKIAVLTLFKHYFLSFESEFQKENLLSIMRSSISWTHSSYSKNIRLLLLQCTVRLGNLGYLSGKEGKEHREFLLSQMRTELNETSQDFLLHLLSDHSQKGFSFLWPSLLDYICHPNYTDILPSLMKVLSLHLKKRRQNSDFEPFVDLTDLPHVSGPPFLLIRLLVLASQPSSTDVVSILSFLLIFIPVVNKHLSSLWESKIPLLLTLLSSGWKTSECNQRQWEDWLLSLLQDSVHEIGLEEWNSVLISCLLTQIPLYYPSKSSERRFALISLGLLLNESNVQSLVSENINSLFSNYSSEEEALAVSLGLASKTHFTLIYSKLKSFKNERRVSSSLFSSLPFLRDKNGGRDEGGSLVKNSHLSLNILREICEKGGLKREFSNEILTSFLLPAFKVEALLTEALKTLKAFSSSLAPYGFILECHSDALSEVLKLISRFPRHSLESLLYLLRLPPSLTFLNLQNVLKTVFESFNFNCPNSETSILKDLLVHIVTLDSGFSLLDEIFTYLEKLLKREADRVRERAAFLLSSILSAHLSKKKVSSSSSMEEYFSPGPYILGSCIPRVFDPSPQVSNYALESLRSLLVILFNQNGIVINSFGPSIELSELKGSLLNFLSNGILHDQFLPFLISALIGLSDKMSSSFSGTAILLFQLLQLRSSEISVHASDLVTKVLEFSLEDIPCEENQYRVCQILQILISSNSSSVLSSLFRLPNSNSLKILWSSISKDSSLASLISSYCLRMLSSFESYLTSDSYGISKALREPLVALWTLRILFKSSNILGEDFSLVVSSLLIALATYVSVTGIQCIKGDTFKSPYEETFSTLQTYFNYQSLSRLGLAMSLGSERVPLGLVNKELFPYIGLVGNIVSSLSKETHQGYLEKLLEVFEFHLTSTLLSSRLAAVVFTSQSLIYSTSSSHNRVSALIRNFKNESCSNVKILTLEGLSTFRDPSDSLLSLVLSALDDDESYVIHSALLSLSLLLSARSSLIPIYILSSCVLKVRPYFDSGGEALSSAALNLFATLLLSLSKGKEEVEGADYETLFFESMNGALVSVLLHISDESSLLVSSSSNVLSVFMSELKVSQDLSPNVGEFVETLRNHFPEFSSHFPLYIMSTLSYFKSSMSTQKLSALRLLTHLTRSPSHDVLRLSDSIYLALLSLLSESNEVIRKEAAVSLGAITSNFFG